MSGYVVSAPARRDLEAIEQYVSADNPAAADRLLDSFRVTGDTLELVRVLHGRRDIERAFGG